MPEQVKDPRNFWMEVRFFIFWTCLLRPAKSHRHLPAVPAGNGDQPRQTTRALSRQAERRAGDCTNQSCHMHRTIKDFCQAARASPGGDARHCPHGANSELGLPAPGRGRPKKRVQEIRLATINIGTLTSRSRELCDRLKERHVDIACVQETKWKGRQAKDIGDGYRLYYTGDSSRQNGVAIIVSGRYRELVTEVTRISDRLMAMKIEADDATLRIVSCYAPQAACTEAEKDVFWRDFDILLRTFDAADYIFVGGDLNGHVGHEHYGFKRYHGGNGYGQRNEDGERILEAAEAHDLAIANTFFKKRESHLITYASGERSTQIDYWMLRRCHLPMVMNAKVIPTATHAFAPQHRLLVLDLRLNVHLRSRARRTTTKRIKWWKLPEHRQQVRDALIDLRVSTDDKESIEEQWNRITSQIRSRAETILGTTKPGRRFVDKQIWWWSESVQQVIKEKKEAFKAWQRSRSNEDFRWYREQNSKAKHAVAEAKEAHYKRLYDELEGPAGANKVYRLAAARHRAKQDIDHVMHIKDAEGNLLTKPRAILKRWSEYYKGLFNEEFPHPLVPQGAPTFGPVSRIEEAEVVQALRKMSSGKAPGPDDIPAEVWKMMGQRGAAYLTSLFNRIIVDGQLPRIWTTSVTVPIWKEKGDVSDCSTYRPIRLLCHTMKIFERVIDARIRSIVEVTPNQCGFVKGSGTINAIHAVRLLMERHLEKRIPIHFAFLDLEKAFDRIPHGLTWYALRQHDVPEEYVRWIKLLYTNTTGAIRCAVGTSTPFPIQVGVHQGSALSPLLFILCMDTVTKDIQLPHP